jgi:hypothetical protein
MFLLALVVLNRLEWPFTIRLYDWRLNEIFGALILVAMAIAIIWFGLSLDRGLLGIILTMPGFVLLISVLGFVTLDLPRTFSRPNPYDLEALDSISVGQEKYRLYSTDSGGVGAISYDLLRRERDTPFGFKLVKSLWASSYYGSELKLQTTNDSSIEVVDKSDGKVVAVIKQ